MHTTIQAQPPFSNLQMELLRLFARQLSDEELLEVQLLLAKHFMDKAMDAADKIWQQNHWTQADAVRLSHEHHRTPYKKDSP